MSVLTRKVDKLNIMLASAKATLANPKKLTKEQIIELESIKKDIQERIDYLMSSI